MPQVCGENEREGLCHFFQRIAVRNSSFLVLIIILSSHLWICYIYAFSLHPERTRPIAALPELCLLGNYKHIKWLGSQPDRKRILQGKNNPLPWSIKTRLVSQINRNAITSRWLGRSCDLRETLIGGRLHCANISHAVPRPSPNYSIHKQRKDIFPGKYLIYTMYWEPPTVKIGGRAVPLSLLSLKHFNFSPQFPIS